MPARVTPPPGRLVRLGVILPAALDSALHLALLCDLAGIDVVWAADDTQARLVRAKVSRIDVLSHPAVAEPWAKTIAVSIGRTRVEATARAALDPRLAGFSEADRAFGSLEDCQAVVSRLSAEGVTDLRCELPDTPDVHDVVAQLTAIAFSRG